MLEAQVEGSERRLRQLAERSAPLAAITPELRRLEVLHPRLDEVRSLLAELEQRRNCTSVQSGPSRASRLNLSP
jgi:hypothetical protein